MVDAIITRLDLDDMADAAAVMRASFDARLPTLAGLHTPAADRAYFREHVFPRCELWGARQDAQLVGIIAFRRGWIEQLYVLPPAQGRGIGRALLALAQSRFPALALWTFQRNEGARRFYEANGFVAVEETDGAHNEEREPDIRYVWREPAAE